MPTLKVDFFYDIGDEVVMTHDKAKDGPTVWVVVALQARWPAEDGPAIPAYFLRSTQPEGYYPRPTRVVECEALEPELLLLDLAAESPPARNPAAPAATEAFVQTANLEAQIGL